jgi:hypothetical protein
MCWLVAGFQWNVLWLKSVWVWDVWCVAGMCDDLNVCMYMMCDVFSGSKEMCDVLNVCGCVMCWWVAGFQWNVRWLKGVWVWDVWCVAGMCDDLKVCVYMMYDVFSGSKNMCYDLNVCGCMMCDVLLGSKEMCDDLKVCVMCDVGSKEMCNDLKVCVWCVAGFQGNILWLKRCGCVMCRQVPRRCAMT